MNSNQSNDNKENGNKKENGNLDKRKLTKAELKRKADFDLMCENLKNEGYEQHNLTMSALFGNIIAFVIAIPIIFIMAAGYMAVNGGLEINLESTNCFILCIGIILFTVVHELIHGVTWAAFAKNHWKAISFGFIVQYLTPYCSCNAPMKKYQIIMGALMPTIVLGVIPGIVTIFTGNSIIWLLAMIMVLGGGGDMACVIKVMSYRGKKKEKLYIDHPYELGIVVFDR